MKSSSSTAGGRRGSATSSEPQSSPQAPATADSEMKIADADTSSDESMVSFGDSAHPGHTPDKRSSLSRSDSKGQEDDKSSTDLAFAEKSGEELKLEKEKEVLKKEKQKLEKEKQKLEKKKQKLETEKQKLETEKEELVETLQSSEKGSASEEFAMKRIIQKEGQITQKENQINDLRKDIRSKEKLLLQQQHGKKRLFGNFLPSFSSFSSTLPPFISNGFASTLF